MFGEHKFQGDALVEKAVFGIDAGGSVTLTHSLFVILERVSDGEPGLHIVLIRGRLGGLLVAGVDIMRPWGS